MGEPRFRLELPPDASHGVTLRLFAAAAAEGNPSTAPLGDDLRLLLSELLANAVERGEGSQPLTIELRPSDDAIGVEATGIGDPSPGDALVDRWRIVEALCFDLRIRDGAGGSLSATMVPRPDDGVRRTHVP